MTTARPFPIGAAIADGGVNFGLFSRTADGVELLLFDREDTVRPARVRLDPVADRAYHDWHRFVPGVNPGLRNGYRDNGPDDPENGLRFDTTEVPLDLYGWGAMAPAGYARDAAHDG